VDKLLDTGIPALNLLLGGGIPRRHLVIVTGDPGTGKTVLCSQIAFAQARMGQSVVVATLASEAQDKLIAELRGFSFFESKRIGDELFPVGAYPWVQKGPNEAKDLLLRTVKERKASMLFIDGLRSLRDLWQSEAKLRDFRCSGACRGCAWRARSAGGKAPRPAGRRVSARVLAAAVASPRNRRRAAALDALSTASPAPNAFRSDRSAMQIQKPTPV
jgi:hypothetical protein